jgi:hypothetical protein
MNYKLIYSQLINRAKSRGSVIGYKERHHIIPKALGGDNSKENLVELTAREHFVAHMLLAKIHGRYMWYAVLKMVGQTSYMNSRLYSIAKEEYSKVLLGNKFSLGVSPNEKTRIKMSISQKKAAPLREKAIAEKRAFDPVFDLYIKKVRSEATKSRKEGYQKKAGLEFKEKFKSDPEYAKKISENRKRANLASQEARKKKRSDHAEMA